MQCSLFFFLGFALFFSNALSLDIFVSPEAIANSPTLVSWARASSDSTDPFQFDLRFIQNDADAGLAQANIAVGPEDDFGHTNIMFPSNGSFQLAAVTGFTNIGMSNKVTIIPPISTTSTTSTSSSTPTPTATSSITAVASSSSTSSSAAPSSKSPSSSGTTHPVAVPTSTSVTKPPLSSRIRARPNLPALVGGILGALAGLALVVAVVIFVHRRRAARRKRLTFHRDMMVQRRLSHAPSLPALVIAHPRPSETFAEDVEQGLPPPSDTDGSTEGGEGHAASDPADGAPVRSATLGTGHIVPPPRGPRPAAKRIGTLTTLRTVGSPLSSPRASTTPTPGTPPAAPARTPRQRELAARQGMLRRQMADLRLELDGAGARSPVSAVSAASAPSGRAGEIHAALDDMQRQMVWLREQEQGAWAQHLTDVLPPGHARFMRP